MNRLFREFDIFPTSQCCSGLELNGSCGTSHSGLLPLLDGILWSQPPCNRPQGRAHPDLLFLSCCFLCISVAMEMLCRMEIGIDWNPAALSCKWLSLPPDLSGSADPSVRGWASDRMEKMQKRVGHKPQLALTGDTETKQSFVER